MEKRKEKNVTDHVSEAAKNKRKALPDYVICVYRVLHEEVGEICVYVNEEFSSNGKSQEVWSISECLRSRGTLILLLLLLLLINRSINQSINRYL